MLKVQFFIGSIVASFNFTKYDLVSKFANQFTWFNLVFISSDQFLRDWVYKIVSAFSFRKKLIHLLLADGHHEFIQADPLQSRVQILKNPIYFFMRSYARPPAAAMQFRGFLICPITNTLTRLIKVLKHGRFLWFDVRVRRTWNPRVSWNSSN